MASQRRGIMGALLNGLDRLRAVGGKTWADVIVVAGVAIAATAAALALMATPIRLMENLTYDLRMSPARRRPAGLRDHQDRRRGDRRRCRRLALPLPGADQQGLAGRPDRRPGRKGVKAIAVDYLLDTWERPSAAAGQPEFADFEKRSPA
jgi:hypothetical protein